MNKFIKASLLAVSLTAFAASAQQTIDNPVTQAMLDVYASELKNNPKDADIYFRRANEYYKFNQYLRALADIDKALEYAPESNTDLRFQSYMLRADIYQMLSKHEESLADFTKAYELDATSFMALYQKANEEYELGDYAAAKSDYTRLRATNPRSVEALTGLARVAVKENNIGLASEYMDGAVDMMSADSDIYIRRALVRKMQNNNTGAVTDLLMSISIDNNPRAFQELINLANEDYPAVMSGLSTSISYAPQQGMLYYIRGFIAQAHDHFSTALADYNKLIDQNMYNYAGLYNSMAQCQLALCKYSEALNNVNQAISMDGGKNAEYYTTKARIYYAMGKNDEAQKNIKLATASGDSSVSTKQFEGFVDFAVKDYSAANDVYAEMIIDKPEDMRNYMYRAWVLADGMKQTSGSQSLYNRIVSLTEDTPESGLAAVNSCRGFALVFAGKKDEAKTWAENLCRDYSNTDGYLSYIAACVYAQAGENDLAFAKLEDALKLGYGNLYEITTANTGRMSLAPIRKDSRLNALIARYAHLFE
jgi:tetratricopeptide (TPR) repeat protein